MAHTGVCYQSLTAHQHQKGHTVPKQVITIATSPCESIRYQAKSEQNVRQDLIPRVGHGEAALSTPRCHMCQSVFCAIDMSQTVRKQTSKKLSTLCSGKPTFYTP